MPTANGSFPQDFIWGAATASYQIEGAAREDGRGESVWDRFAATPGKVRNGDSGAIACDFYHRYPQDVALMRELGIGAFRFSIAWPRVLPSGRGASTRPASTSTTGSSTSSSPTTSSRSRRSSTGTRRRRSRTTAAGRRARPRRVRRVHRGRRGRLGDRVRHWMTHNEPWVYAWIGHSWGKHAPGRTNEADAVATAHHLLLSHGWAAEAIRRASPTRKSGSRSTSPTRIRPPTRRRTRRPPGASTAPATAGSSTRSSAARTRPTCSTGASWSHPSSWTATWRRSRRRSTSSASTTTSASSSPPPTRGRGSSTRRARP